MTHPRPGRGDPWPRRVLVAAAATLLIVAACGPNAATQAPVATAAPSGPAATDEANASAAPSLPSDPVTLRMAYYNAGGQTEIDYRQAQADEFMALHPNVTLKMEPVGDWGEVITPQIAAGEAADVIWADTDTGYGKFAGIGTYQSLNPFIEKDGYDLSPWPTTMIDHFRNPDGGLLLLPNSNLGFNFVYYNKKLFDEANLPYPTNEWTIDDLTSTARKLAKPGEQWGLSLAWAELYVTWMEMFGCELSDSTSNPTQYTYNTPECVKALEELDKLSREGVLNWDFGAKFNGLGPGDTSGEQNFSLGNVGMLLSGTWEAPSIAANSGGAFEFDAAPLPVEPGSAIQHAASGFGMYSKTENPEWAWEVIKYFAGPEGQEADAKQGLGQAAIQEILDQVYCAADAPPANRCQIAKLGAEAAVWEPATGEWSAGFWDVISPGLEGAFTGDQPVDWQKTLDDLVVQSQQAAPLP